MSEPAQPAKLPAPEEGDIVKFGAGEGSSSVYNTCDPYVLRNGASRNCYEYKLSTNDSSWSYDTDAMQEEVAACEAKAARLRKKLELITSVAPETVSVDGIVDDVRGIQYIGLATKMASGKWRCLAIVGEALAVVEVTLSFQPAEGPGT